MIIIQNKHIVLLAFLFLFIGFLGTNDLFVTTGELISCIGQSCNANNIQSNLKAYYISNDQKQELPMFSSAGSSSITQTNKLFFSDSIYPLNINKPIYSLSISANINLISDNSLVRIILVDKNKKEYLVYEGYPLIVTDKTFKIENFCDETCVLGGVFPSSLKIQVISANININSISFSDSFNKLTSGVASKEGLISKNNFKINKINTQIKEKGMKWTAGETSVSKLSYEQKKKLFLKPDGVPLDKLPNLQGFEYYKGGIFELDLENGTQNNSSLPKNWDWRNVHGENWLTPIKDQGLGGTCWAHSNIGTLESHINLYFNQHLDIDLSEQMLVDCSNPGSIQDIGGLPIECIENICYPGYNYCKIMFKGIADEACDYYAQRDFSYSPSACDYNYICSNWQNRVWKVSDFHDYKFFNDRGTPNCQKQTMDLSEDEFKKILINKGPMDSGILSWNHAMVLVGYENSDNGTIWIYKNSWGKDWGENGYAKIIVSLEDLGWGSLPIGPFIPPKNQSYKINCIDKDNDSYCNWGISEDKPSTCPSFCKPKKDCDDSNSSLNTFDSNFNCIKQCTNECNVIGTKQCASTISYKICGNYNNYNCLELSKDQYCPKNYICYNGLCLLDKSKCKDKKVQSCVASNRCRGSKTCSFGKWGICTTTLQKCPDGTCKTSCK